MIVDLEELTGDGGKWFGGVWWYMLAQWSVPQVMALSYNKGNGQWSSRSLGERDGDLSGGGHRSYESGT